MDTDIDIVIAYVDGSDEIWLRKRADYQNSPSADKEDRREIRYRNWDNLHYLFRGIDVFMPWVRRVFLVTDHQVPNWLNTDNRRLSIVNHDEFINECYLPVFSADPIELNLHRIKGLSECFLYFNDDMFPISELRPTDFFVNGLPCDYAVEAPLQALDMTFYHILANNILLLNQQYDRSKVYAKYWKKFFSPVYPSGMFQNFIFSRKRTRFFGFKNVHCIYPLKKSAMEAMWKESFDWLDHTCRNRFRASDDLNINCMLHYQYVNGMFHPYNRFKKFKFFRVDDSSESLKRITDAVENQKYGAICINDNNVDNFNMVKDRINDSLSKILSNKSNFEI